jgi:hypothetical protein
MKKLLLAVLLVVSAFGVFLFTSTGNRGTPGETRAATTTSGSSERATEERLELPVVKKRESLEPLVAEPSNVQEAASELAPSAAPDPRPTALGPLGLSGSISVVDATGLEHPGEDGSFMLFAYGEDNEGRGVDVEVQGGTWSASFAGLEVAGPVRAIHVVNLRLGGRVAVLEQGQGETMKLPARGFLDLRARWLTSIVLHVQDHETGQELPEVELVEVEHGIFNTQHPGPSDGVSLGVEDSPIELEASEENEWRRVIHARSPGYAWGRIEIDPSRPQDRFLLLDPGGNLGVTLTGAVHEPGTRLRVIGGRAHQPLFDAELRGQYTFEIASFPAGRYQVRVGVGDWWRDSRVLGEAEVEVVAGQRADVVLAVEALEPVERVPLEGTLVLLAEWGIEEPSIALELLDPPSGNQETHSYIDGEAMTRVEGSPNTFRWSAGAVQPGRYEIGLYEPPFSVSLAVGPTGERDARVVVPPPCEVFVRCVDDETGADIDVEDLHWSCRRPQWVNGGSLSSARFDDALSRWRFRAPMGEIDFKASDHRYAHHQGHGTVVNGTNEFVLRLRPVTGVLLVLRDGEAEIGWDDHWSANLSPLRATNHGWSKARVDGRLLIGVQASGPFRLTVSEIPGYEPVPEETIEIERGKVLEHVIELRRR